MATGPEPDELPDPQERRRPGLGGRLLRLLGALVAGLLRLLGVLAAKGGRAGARKLTQELGGRERTRVIVLLAAVLALSSADASTVGASATELRHALHITNTDIGLLVAVTSLVAAVASLPFGVLADRVRRTRVLGGRDRALGRAR